MRPADRARLEALVESDDAKITPRDRIEAIKLLRDGAIGREEGALMQVVAELRGMTGRDLDYALSDYFAPGDLMGDRPAPKFTPADREQSAKDAEEEPVHERDHALTPDAVDQHEDAEERAAYPMEQATPKGLDADILRRAWADRRNRF
jgi:hypothetical protein